MSFPFKADWAPTPMSNGIINAVSCYKKTVQISASLAVSVFQFLDEICGTAMWILKWYDLMQPVLPDIIHDFLLCPSMFIPV